MHLNNLCLIAVQQDTCGRVLTGLTCRCNKADGVVKPPQMEQAPLKHQHWDLGSARQIGIQVYRWTISATCIASVIQVYRIILYRLFLHYWMLMLNDNDYNWFAQHRITLKSANRWNWWTVKVQLYYYKANRLHNSLCNEVKLLLLLHLVLKEC